MMCKCIMCTAETIMCTQVLLCARAIQQGYSTWDHNSIVCIVNRVCVLCTIHTRYMIHLVHVQMWLCSSDYWIINKPGGCITCAQVHVCDWMYMLHTSSCMYVYTCTCVHVYTHTSYHNVRFSNCVHYVDAARKNCVPHIDAVRKNCVHAKCGLLRHMHSMCVRS